MFQLDPHKRKSFNFQEDSESKGANAMLKIFLIGMILFPCIVGIVGLFK